MTKQLQHTRPISITMQYEQCKLNGYTMRLTKRSNEHAYGSIGMNLEDNFKIDKQRSDKRIDSVM